MMQRVLQESDAVGAVPDLAERRRQRLVALVEARGSARLEELSSALGVSQATVRRDLDAVSASSRLRRVHGGVVARDQRLDEPQFDAKAGAAAAEKERIAAAAVKLLGPTDTVYLDSGTTVLAVARLLHGWNRLTVVTNSLPVATELVGRGPRVIVVGGELRATSRAIVGPLTRHLLDELHVDRALMGTYALSLDDGLTTTDPSEAFTKELIMTQAGEVILLADGSKIGTRSFVASGRLADVDVLVTDAALDRRTGQALGRLGVRVITA